MPEASGLPTGHPPLEDEPVDAAVSGSELVFDGRVWGVRRDRFGYNGSAITREYVDHPGAVAVLAIAHIDPAGSRVGSRGR